jgi:hypothetical protein
VPITVTTYTPEQRAAERARRLAYAGREVVARIGLPTGPGAVLDLEKTPDGYELTGDLRLFGIDAFDACNVLPVPAADDGQAVAAAERLVRKRWELEGRG